jgi:superfamily II DNA helicase RecQ
MDIPDVERVVQYMVPSSLSIWIQRAGRAGRSGQPAVSILLVERSVFQKTKRKATIKVEDNGEKDEINDGDVSESEPDSEQGDVVHEHKKKLEHGMRNWIEAQSCACRRIVSDKYFQNPVRNARKSCGQLFVIVTND